MNKEEFVIIDGNSLMYRAFYGMPPLTNSKGLHTNVILGMINMLTSIREKHKPKYFAIAFDKKAPTFRHETYAEYKAGRQKMPDEMVEQIPVLKQVLTMMNIDQIELDRYEADDIIGTIADNNTKNKIKTLIVTGDKDAFQLINDYTHVLYNRKGIHDMEEYDEKLLMEKMEVTPSQIIDLKALMGDSSDNIPGIAGIGPKSALDLLKKFGTLDNIYANSDSIEKKGIKEKVQNNRDIAYKSYELATIFKEVPIDVNVEKYLYKEPDIEKLRDIYEELGFKSLLSKLPKKAETIQGGLFDFLMPPTESNVKTIDPASILEDINKNKKLYFKTDKEFFYALNNDEVIRFNINTENILKIKDILENADIKKYGHDLKEENIKFKSYDVNMEGEYFDIAIASYLINPIRNRHDITEYASTEEVLVTILPKICDTLMNKMKEQKLDELFHSVEMPLVNILADMEYIGFKVDQDILKSLGQEFQTQIETLTASIYSMAGEEFNINSPKQLGTILFEKLGLPTGKKTKTGYSTNVDVLENLASQHEIVAKVLEYRTIAKLKSTYIDGLLNIIDINTGRIHSKLNQMVTSTGRLSSTEPNLQNIPIRMEAGRKIRDAFIPKDGCSLVDADYSQIELRVLAHISEDAKMIEAFSNDIDIHTKTASEVFNVSLDEVTKAMRGRAKAINFGIVYGLSDYGLGKDLGITRKEAKAYIENYFKEYTNVFKYTKDIVQTAKENEYVTTLLGRRRYIPEVNSPNAIMRGSGDRMAMNTPIQGSAADIIKIAMVKVHRTLEERKLKSKLILQVHDELIVETYKEEEEQVKQLVKDCMETAINLKVPLKVDINIQKSWGK